MKLRFTLLILLILAVLSVWYVRTNGIDNDTVRNMDKNIHGNYSTQELLGLEDGQSIEYGGKFIDDNGITNIWLVYKSAKNISQKDLNQRIEEASKKTNVKILDARYSLAVLENINKALTDKSEDLAAKGVSSVYVDEALNSVHVTVKEANKDVKDAIDRIVDSSAIVFEESSLEVTY